MTLANPVPSEAFAGFSFAPLSVAVKVIGVALAAEAMPTRKAEPIAISFARVMGRLLSVGEPPLDDIAKNIPYEKLSKTEDRDSRL
jgi:hypothetical protein